MGSPDAELVDVELDGSYCQVMADNLKFDKALKYKYTKGLYWILNCVTARFFGTSVFD